MKWYYFYLKLKQNENQPLSFENQVSIFYAANQGALDDVEIDQIPDFENQWYDFVSANLPEVMKSISEEGELSDSSKKSLDDALKTFKGTFGK